MQTISEGACVNIIFLFFELLIFYKIKILTKVPQLGRTVADNIVTNLSMSKRKHVALKKGPFEIVEDPSTVIENFKTAVQNSDIRAIGSILQDIAVDKGPLREQCPDIYAAGEEIFTTWKNGIRVKDSVYVWDSDYHNWFKCTIKNDLGDMNFRVHFHKFPDRYDQNINLICTLILPDDKPKTKSVRTKRKIYDIVEVDSNSGDLLETSTEIDEERAFKSASGRLLRGTAVRKSLDRCNHKISSQSGDGCDSVDIAAAIDFKETVKERRKRHDPNDRLEDDADWICHICRQMEAVDGSNLLLCEGGCKRSFHFSCLGLDEVKALLS